MKTCDNCGGFLDVDTTHQPATDEMGPGICVVTYHPPGETAWQDVPPRKTFTTHVAECLDNTAATVRRWRKPHLRLECQPHPLHGMVWRMSYVRGPSQRVRRASFWHTSAQGAIWSAVALWF